MMAKAQKAAEQATELRKHNEELEAHQLQLQSENKTLSQKVKSLEEGVQDEPFTSLLLLLLLNPYVL